MPVRYDPGSNAFVGEKGDLVAGELPHVMWHVTDKCPLACPFCFATKTERATPLVAIDAIVRPLKLLRVQKVDIAGGEPMVYPYLPQIVEALTSAGIYCTVTTSGVSSNENSQFLLRNLERFTRVIVSLDAPTADQHNSLRRNNAAWRSANALLGAIPEADRRQRARVNTVVTRPFVAGSWCQAMATYVESCRLREWCLIEPHPANAKEHFTDFDITSEEFDEVLQTARGMAPTTTVLHRTRRMYSTYWAVHPDGTLRQHSTGAVDQLTLALLTTDPDELRAAIVRTNTVVPTPERTRN